MAAPAPTRRAARAPGRSVRDRPSTAPAIPCVIVSMKTRMIHLRPRGRLSRPTSSLSDSSLDGKVALVTGASSGLGRAFALALADAGARVFLTARREDKLREAVGEIKQRGGEAAYHVVDVRVVPALYDLVDVLLARFRRLDILINNAGLGYRSPLLETRRSEIAEMLETNLASAIYLSQA